MTQSGSAVKTMSEGHDIIGLGVIAVDEMLYVDSYPPANAKLRISGRRRQGGGNVSCGLAAAAGLGSTCAALGRLGNNELSEFVKKRLSAAGVDLSLIVWDSDSEPLYCIIVVAADTGSRSIYTDYSNVRPLEAKELRAEWFSGSKVLLVDNMHTSAILPAVRMARQAGLQVVSDIEGDLPDLAEIRRYIDHYICSAEYALPFTGCGSAERACELMSRSADHRSVVITAGADGCYWTSAGQHGVRHLPAHKVKAVDTTGCGDVFHGAFCHGLAAGWPVDRVIRYASAAAAVKATRTGGWAAVPTMSEVTHLLEAGIVAA